MTAVRAWGGESGANLHAHRTHSSGHYGPERSVKNSAPSPFNTDITGFGGEGGVGGTQPTLMQLVYIIFLGLGCAQKKKGLVPKNSLDELDMNILSHVAMAM